jgi:hypothetical protein
MKFDARKFVREADAAFSVAKESPLVPIFEYVLIKPMDGERVSLTATNYAHSINVIAQCIHAPMKGFCVHSTVLWPVLKTLDGPAEITLGDNFITLRCGGVSLDVPMLPDSAFSAPDSKGGTKVMSDVEIEPFLKVISDMSFFLASDTGNDASIKPQRQNVLISEKGAYAFDLSACGATDTYRSETPFMVPPGIRRMMSKFTGKWNIFSGSGWIRFEQGKCWYKMSMPEFDKAGDSAAIVHSVISTASTSPQATSFEVARIAPSIARAMLVGAIDVSLQGVGDKITVSCKDEFGRAALEEEIPADGAVFKTTMRAKTLHGVLEIVGYAGIVVIIPQTEQSKIDAGWPPSILVKGAEKRFMALIAPVTFR